MDKENYFIKKILYVVNPYHEFTEGNTISFNFREHCYIGTVTKLYDKFIVVNTEEEDNEECIKDLMIKYKDIDNMEHIYEFNPWD